VSNTTIAEERQQRKDHPGTDKPAASSPRDKRKRVDPAEAAMNRNPNPSPPLVFETPAAATHDPGRTGHACPDRRGPISP
jgi:hypothetical protein